VATSCYCSTGNLNCSDSGIRSALGTLADGPVQIQVRLTSGSATVDDAFVMFKDSLPPGVSIASPSQGQTLGQADVTSLNLSGTGGPPATGNTVELFYYPLVAGGNSPDTQFASATCVGMTWSVTADISSAPDGMLGIMARVYGSAGPDHESHISIS